MSAGVHFTTNPGSADRRVPLPLAHYAEPAVSGNQREGLPTGRPYRRGKAPAWAYRALVNAEAWASADDCPYLPTWPGFQKAHG